MPLAAAFDPAVLRAMFGQESSVVGAVLETFFVSMDGQVRELETAAASGDPVAVGAIAHRIKGAARMSGAMALAAAAESLEDIGRAGFAAGLDRALADVQQQWRRLQRDPAFRHARRVAAAD